MVTSLHIAKTFTANPQNEEILKKLHLISPQLTNLFQSNVEQYFYLDLYASVVGVTWVVCLGYVYKPDGLYLFAHAGDYRLIKIDAITSFVIIDQCFDGTYLTYEQYRNEGAVQKCVAFR